MQGTIMSDKMIRRERMETFIKMIELEHHGISESMMREAIRQLKNTNYMMAFITPIKDKEKREKRINLWARSFFMPDLVRKEHKDAVESGEYIFSEKQKKILEEIKKREIEEGKEG